MSDMDHLMSVYKRRNIRFVSGKGNYLVDTSGKEYLDAISGVAVTSLGHSHPEISAVIAIQASRLLHTSNMFSIEWQERLGEKLCRISGMSRAFFCNSGAEANETALKLARLHGTRKGFVAPEVIVMDKSFHGRTFATLSASGNPAGQAGFAPLMPGFRRVPFGDTDAIRVIAAQGSQVTAVLMEPVQGEGGVNVASPDFLQEVRQICNEQGWLLMLDEVQTGIGRTGKWFGFQHADILPDVITVAKALGNGIPVGGCLASGEAAEYFMPGNHGSTFGGNPLACRVGCQVIDIIERDNLLLKARKGGELLRDYLRSQMQDFECVTAIRSHGMMAGIEFNRPCEELADICATQEKLLINVTREKTVRLLPSLISTEKEIAMIAQRLSRAAQTWLRKK